jgi:cytidyltransferase-like protein
MIDSTCLIVDRDELVTRTSTQKAKGSRFGLAGGCFDILHAGHVRYLKSARLLGDFLVVGVNSDAQVAALKGEGRPILPERERAELVAFASGGRSGNNLRGTYSDRTAPRHKAERIRKGHGLYRGVGPGARCGTILWWASGNCRRSERSFNV